MCVAIGVGVLVESLQVGGVPGGVLGEQQAARAGLLLEDVAEESTEGVELLLCPLPSFYFHLHFSNESSPREHVFNQKCMVYIIWCGNYDDLFW